VKFAVGPWLDAGRVVDDPALEPPPDAIALDQETYNWMISRYPWWQVRAGPGVKLVQVPRDRR
jgi:hypothetical protein